jgi:KaiC/GvpD/RAD55 family RecA-like ATPase
MSMTTQSPVAALKQRFENLFPGKWVNVDERQKTLLTGLSEIDQSLTRGLARQRITEWTGPPSSGKTSTLRAIINHWCAAGFDVAYVDTENQLVASDWAFAEQASTATRSETSGRKQGRFWVIRNLEASAIPNIHSFNKVNHHWKRKSLKQNHLWAADELIRTNAFDVVVLDLGASERTKPIHSRIYARLQNSLGKSRTALIVLRDTEAYATNPPQPGWGSYAQLNFKWGSAIKNVSGLMGTTMILPSISCNVVKDGLSQSGEVAFAFNVSNRLFTHPSVPDRRSSKA